MGLALKSALVAIVGLSTSVSFAAIPPKQTVPEIAPSKKILLKATRDALSLPIDSRMQALRKQGGEGYRNLVSIMFNGELPMETRWRAVTAAGRMGGRDSLPELERAMAQPEWYMRSAGLVAIKGVDREATLKWSKKLLSDKALVVRASAVSVIAEMKDSTMAPVLWEKLYAKENFKGKQSLFIRHRILDALANIEMPGREGKFIEALADKDETLHGPAITALERLTNQKLGKTNDTLALKRERWQSWAKSQKL